MRALLVALVLAGLAAAVPAHAAASRPCGLTPRIGGVRYDIRAHSSVSCRTARRVAARFLRTGTAARPWVCFRTHGDAAVAARCARGTRVLVRVLAPE